MALEIGRKLAPINMTAPTVRLYQGRRKEITLPFAVAERCPLGGVSRQTDFSVARRKAAFPLIGDKSGTGKGWKGWMAVIAVIASEGLQCEVSFQSTPFRARRHRSYE
jgi:hypothetical protein